MFFTGHEIDFNSGDIQALLEQLAKFQNTVCYKRDNSPCLINYYNIYNTIQYNTKVYCIKYTYTAL